MRQNAGRSFQAGVRYQCNPKTTIRAKVNSAGLVSACAVNKCCDKVSVTVTAAVSKQKIIRVDGISRRKGGGGDGGGGGLFLPVERERRGCGCREQRKGEAQDKIRTGRWEADRPRRGESVGRRAGRRGGRKDLLAGSLL